MKKMKLLCTNCGNIPETGYTCCKLPLLLTDDIRVNFNIDKIERLEEINGIGSITAQEIVDKRPYNNIYDLTKVSGISKRMVEEWNNKGRIILE